MNISKSTWLPTDRSVRLRASTTAAVDFVRGVCHRAEWALEGGSFVRESQPRMNIPAGTNITEIRE